MPVDLDKIRALLASVAGFTKGPWRIAYTAGQGGIDSSKVYTDAIGEHPFCIGDVNRYRYVPEDQKLFAAAPDLHRELTEAVGEIERLTDENGHLAALVKAGAWETSLAVAPLNAEIGRLRAVFAKVAEVAADASKNNEPGSAWWLTRIVAAMPGRDWEDVPGALGRLAAGEVDDG